jgi:opacity protein-like surface antigen
MKRLLPIIALLLPIAIPAIAGTTEDKTIVQPTAANDETGFYIGPDGGFNVYHANPTAGKPGIGNEKVDLGGYVGGKFGYTFRTGPVLPSFETDLFYNRFGGSWDRVYYGPKHRNRETESYQINSGAFLENALLRYDVGPLQPYIGAGIGAYVNDSSRQQTDRNYYTGRQYSYGTFHHQSSSWAWQLVAGADYFVKPNISLFVEYKFLNYMDSDPHGRLGQQLLGGGVRYHF